jgi:transcriptional regulator with XRE-family HTH domain
MAKDEKVMTVFPRRLKQARLLAALTQEQLGIRAEIDEFSASARVNQYERGVHAPDYGTSTRLAKALKVPVSFLYEPDDRIADLILIMGKLAVKDRERVLTIAKGQLLE